MMGKRLFGLYLAFSVTTLMGYQSANHNEQKTAKRDPVGDGQLTNSIKKPPEGGVVRAM